MRPWVAIRLTGKYAFGQYALVDEADLPLLSGAKRWFVNGGYAYASIGGSIAIMHRLILAANRGQIVDHVNRNKLDNRRSNLRFATASQSTANTLNPRRVGYYRGIAKCRGGWMARCQCKGQMLCGVAPTPDAAAHLYDEFARQLHGEFAILNFQEAA